MTAVADRVRAELEELILSGGVAAGGRINADDHARRAGISHIPVREALRALQADGWIELRPHQGAFVRRRDPRELADLFEARLQLEGDVAALAAQRRTAAQLDALDAVLDRQAAAADPAVLSRINAEFHVLLAGCSQNAVLTEYVRDLSKRVRFYFVPTATARRGRSLDEHRAIVEAVRTRDPDHARQLVRAHIASTREDAERALAGAGHALYG
jgi:DNA-binding GntR family transcriptional regulator